MLIMHEFTIIYMLSVVMELVSVPAPFAVMIVNITEYATPAVIVIIGKETRVNITTKVYNY